MRDRWIRLAVLMAAVSLMGGCQSGGLDFDIADLNPFGGSGTCAAPAPTAPAPCDPPPQDPCAPTPVAAQPMGQRPPDANPGEVWCYVRVPAVTETVSEQVCVQQETCRQVWVEPVTKQVTENVCVTPESVRRIDIPAVFTNVAKQVCIAPGKTEWRRVDCEAKNLKPQEQIGECWTLVDVPPAYTTETTQVCTQQASCREETIPGVFEPKTRTVEVTPGFYKQVSVPAVFETKTSEVVVSAPRWEWRRTKECEVPAAAGSTTAPIDTSYDPGADNTLPPMSASDSGASDSGASDSAPGGSDLPPAGNLPPLDPMAPIR